MKERYFTLTSTKYKGFIWFKFGLNGYLISFKIDAALTQKQHLWALNHLPQHISQIPQFAKLNTSFKIKENLVKDNHWVEDD